MPAKSLRAVLAACAAIGVIPLAAPAPAQMTRPMPPPRPMPGPEPEAIIYRDAGFNGPAVAVSQEQPDLRLAWRVNSIRIKAGEWQVCEKPNFRGTCIVYRNDTPLLGNVISGRKVQSMRLIGGWQRPPLGDGGPSLRGMASQYFTQPAHYGQRVPACPTGSATAACGARNADAFCHSMGWNGAAWQMVETVGRVTYLADVLCTRTGY